MFLEHLAVLWSFRSKNLSLRREHCIQADALGVKLEMDVVRPKIPFSAMLETFRNVEVVDDFFSSAVQAKTQALKTYRLKTFPEYLMIQVCSSLFYNVVSVSSVEKYIQNYYKKAV